MKENFEKLTLEVVKSWKVDGTPDSYIDRLLQINSFEIEKELALEKGNYKESKRFQSPQLWYGLGDQLLQTPYGELIEAFGQLESEKIKSIIDIGCGYGRVGIIASVFFPESKFLGYELEPKRVQEARRIGEKLKIKNYEIQEANVLSSNFELPLSEVYFIYDFSEPRHIRMILDKLKRYYETSDFFIIARGKGVRSLVQYKYPVFINAFRPYHSENFSIYSSFKDVENFSG